MNQKPIIFSKILKAYYILPMITLFMFAGFIASLLFPNKVLDTYVVNMSEEEGDTQVLLPLSCGENNQHLYYFLDSLSRSMRGIQVGIDKGGKDTSALLLNYDVYLYDYDEEAEEINMEDGELERGGKLVCRNQYDLAQGDSLQFVYLPYSDYEPCVGKLCVDFYISSKDGQTQGEVSLVANHAQVDGVITYYEQAKWSLKASHIYTHDTYPFLYDFRIMSFVFLAASMAVSYPFANQKKEEKKKKAEGGKS